MNIILDTETTGLDNQTDEILQLSIIDDCENVLFNKYFKPTHCTSWEGAEKVNGITPGFVADKPPISDYIAEISEIMQRADEIIGYNTQFDLGFLRSAGVDIGNGTKIIDVMQDFAEVYGEWNEEKGGYKWQKLTKAAEYYEYDWSTHGNAHNSLADCFATLYVYQKMTNNEHLDFLIY